MGPMKVVSRAAERRVKNRFEKTNSVYKLNSRNARPGDYNPTHAPQHGSLHENNTPAGRNFPSESNFPSPFNFPG